MIYLTTGGNGAGKTLLTLQDVRNQQLKENRPVYFHGFEIEPSFQAESGWIYWDDPKKWMDIPEGSICLFDECQTYFGKSNTRDVPQFILDLAQFRRKRGIDMWLLLPHPSMLHVDIRRLVESPSWHRHVKRAFGSDMASVTTYSVPNLRCEEGSTDEKGVVAMRPYPKEVYKWYRSASLHTGKRKIPRAFWVLAFASLCIPALAYFAWDAISGLSDPDKITKSVLGTPAGIATDPARLATSTAGSAAITSEEYARARTPRFDGLPHTAPAYDELTRPVRAPYPAACVSSRNRCVCYSDQATPIQTPKEVCLQIVAGGIYVDWEVKTMGAGTGTSAPRSPSPELASSAPGTSAGARGSQLEAMPVRRDAPASPGARAPGELL